MISRILVPPKGWLYKQGDTLIYGETFEDLKSNVTFHRESNDIPLGDVEKDIETQLETLYPNIKVNILKLKAVNGRKHV